MTIQTCCADKTLLQHVNTHAPDMPFFDAFGSIDSSTEVHPSDACQDFHVRNMTAIDDVPIILAAFHSAVVHYGYEPRDDA